MDIRQLESPVDRERWDAFVEGCPDATFFHLAGWRDVISKSFGHPVYFLFAERDGQITGVLPLAHIRSRLFGRRLVSLPFCVYGGVAAVDADSRRALIGHAQELARRLAVDFLELRNVRAVDGLPTASRYVTFRRELFPEPERNMSAIPRKQRAMIRKGAAKGLSAHTGAACADFYRIYAESLRDLGTPVLPARYFECLQRVFAGRCEIMTVAPNGGDAIAAVMTFYFRDEVLPYYGGGTPLARQYHAYDFMYWELLVHALGRGARVFDFGRSREGSGSYRFKTHWGFEPTPLQYQYDLVRASDIPNVTPDNPRYHALIKAWQKLPLPVTKMIGPWLARSLG